MSDLLSDISPDMMLDLLNERGFSGEILQSNTGGPLVRFMIENCMSGVYFLVEGEDKPDFYQSIQFAAMFRQRLPLEVANRWNREQRHVKLYADIDGQLTFEMDVSLNGGVTRQFLIERLNDWYRLFPRVLIFVSQPHS